jgi:hypothetical protein
VDFTLKPSKRQPIEAARVAQPAKSMRRNFEYNDWFFASEESGIETFNATRTNEKAKMGIYSINRFCRFADVNPRVRQAHIRLTWNKKADRLRGFVL